MRICTVDPGGVEDGTSQVTFIGESGWSPVANATLESVGGIGSTRHHSLEE